jgi:hypothetical protein
MKSWSERLRRLSAYQVVLHVVVLGLAVEVLFLARENRELKSAVNSYREREIRVGDRLSLANLLPVTTSNTVDSTTSQLIYVFTTGCHFCEKNIAAWKEVSKTASRRQIRVIAICLDVREKASAYAAKFHLSYDIYAPNDASKYRRENHIVGVPNTILRSASGKVEWTWPGLLDSHQMNEIAEAISNYPHIPTIQRR